MILLKKVIALFQNIHIQSLLGNGVMAIFGVVSLGLLYRALSIEDIGIYVFFMTIYLLMDNIKMGLLTNAFLKFYSGTTGQRANEVLGSTWALGLALTGFFILLNIASFFVMHFIKNEGLLLLIQYFSFIALATLPSFMANLVVQGDKRFDRLLWLRLINQVIFTGTILVLMILKKSTLHTIILTFIGANLIASIATILFGWTKIGTLKYSSKKTFLDIFHFGKYSMGTNLSSKLFGVVDIFFINYFLGSAALAMYNLGGRLLQFVEIPLLSFAASGMPSLAAFFNNDKKDEMMYLMKKIVGMLTFGFIIIAVFSIIFAQPIITIIGGEKYAHSETVNLFRIFMIIAIMYPSDRFFALTLDVMNKPNINFYKIIVMLLINLVADYAFILVFKNVYGIAFANVFPVLAAISISYFYLNKYSPFNFWGVFKVGFVESIALVKLVYQNTFSKSMT